MVARAAWVAGLVAVFAGAIASARIRGASHPERSARAEARDHEPSSPATPQVRAAAPPGDGNVVASIAPAAGAVGARDAVGPRGRSFVGVVLPRQTVDLTAAVDGKVRSVSVRLGDSVRAGAALIAIDAPRVRHDLESARVAVASLEVERERAAVELAEAEERLGRRKALAADALTTGEDLSAAGYARRYAKLRLDALDAQLRERRARAAQLDEIAASAQVPAPFDGTVVGRFVDVGAAVGASTVLLRLADTAHLFVRFAAPEDAALRVGGAIEVRDAEGDAITSGRIEAIAAEVDAASRMIVAEASVAPRTDGAPALLAGTRATVRLTAEAP